MKVFLLIVAITVGVVWWYGHEGSAPEVVDGNQLEQEVDQQTNTRGFDTIKKTVSDMTKSVKDLLP